ncbi:hypothetical protein [Roseateles sp.]|uniref:hypothetical protein n=1 Tax=Roseateles sp. TaxID=1971397 RepID=UPI0025E18B1C|nr:hypothetical protein [Roseateles sp.]MBV8034586.1 hypothetical protein [Roseateles sp.]
MAMPPLQHQLLVHGVAHQLDEQTGLKRFAHQSEFQFGSHRFASRLFEVHIAGHTGELCFKYRNHLHHQTIEVQDDDVAID